MRGRPRGSEIRQHVVEILYYLERATGYDIHKIYEMIFSSCAQRSIYYALSSGVKYGIFVVEKVDIQKGEFSWGDTVQKIYYRLGPEAQPKGLENVKQVISELKSVRRLPK